MKDRFSFQKIKKWFSFSKLLHNDKLMMMVSLLLSVAIWASVISGPANITERSISVKVTVDLTGSYAYQSGLRIVSDNEFAVKVNVSGPWSVLMKLDESDLRVKADLTAITGAGDIELPITVSRNSGLSGYDILSINPSTVTVVCDYWQEGAIFSVETDVSTLTVTDVTNTQVGEPVLDKTSFPSGIVTMDGPKTVISKIDRIVARVTDTKPLDGIRQYEVPLIGLDDDGNELDLSDCTFREIPNGKVRVTVPLWENRHIAIGYEVVNCPSGIDPKEYLVTQPSSMDVYGTAAELDALEVQLNDLGTVDFSELSLTNDTIEFPLTIPSTMRTVDGSSKVIVRLMTDGLSQKTVSFLPTKENVVVSGNFNGYTVHVPSQSVQSVLLVGNERSIDAITKDNLSLQVELNGTPTAGTKSHVAHVKINRYDDVWAYYGSQSDGVTLSLTLQ